MQGLFDEMQTSAARASAGPAPVPEDDPGDALLEDTTLDEDLQAVANVMTEVEGARSELAATELPAMDSFKLTVARRLVAASQDPEEHLRPQNQGEAQVRHPSDG